MATTTRRQSQATTLTRLDTTWRSVLELQLFCSWFLLITRWSNFAAETIMMGQSNMLGEGKIEGWNDGTLEYATHMKRLYPYLLDATTNTPSPGDTDLLESPGD